MDSYSVECISICVSVCVCAGAIHDASQVLPVLPEKEGPCLLCVCFLDVVVVVVCVFLGCGGGGCV